MTTENPKLQVYDQPPDLKPGYATSEFWLTTIVAIPSMLVAAGIIPSGDQGMLAGCASKVITGLIAAVTLYKYIHSRMHIKGNAWAILFALVLIQPASAQVGAASPPAADYTGMAADWKQQDREQIKRQQIMNASFPDPVWIAHTGLFHPDYTPWLNQITQQNSQIIQLHQQIVLLLAQRAQPAPQVYPAPVSPPSPTPLSDPETKALLQQLLNQQEALNNSMQMMQIKGTPSQPAPPPQLILLTPPKQEIPLGAGPHQNIPLGDQPHQQIPLGGPPLQQIPLGQPPHQNIPLGGPPQQQIDLGLPAPGPALPNLLPGDHISIPAPKPPTPQQIKQLIPLGPPAPAPTGYQRYSRTVYLPESCWRPVYAPSPSFSASSGGYR